MEFEETRIHVCGHEAVKKLLRNNFKGVFIMKRYERRFGVQKTWRNLNGDLLWILGFICTKRKHLLEKEFTKFFSTIVLNFLAPSG